jgi:hypothetical protein
MPEATLTTQAPGQPPHTRPVPPSWASVAPLLERWQMALVPHLDRVWEVIAFAGGSGPRASAHRVPWPEVPQAIVDLAARCEAATGE